MFRIDAYILITGVLILLGIISSKFSARFGLPVLVLFLGVGMLAGSEGIGGIAFENYERAHAIGTVALAFILFDGGLSTPLRSIRLSWRPALVLATLGVLMTAMVTGVAAAFILHIPLLEGMLLGSIVGSTDAAAVFGVLRSGGTRLPERLSSALEMESGSNDPMAIFMTIGCIQILTGGAHTPLDLAELFVRQMVLGSLVGILAGLGTVWVVNRINLATAGLYPVLVSAFGLLTFGLAAWAGGSGFVAVYLAGIVIGNSRLVFQRGIFLFHDATAWLSQIIMFVVLGLLSFPSRLLEVGWQAVAIAVVLTLVARPLAVVTNLLPFGYSWREQLVLSWGGLKGAVPVTLATFPLLFDLPRALLIFNVVFFVVLLSALVQGWTLPMVARRVGLELPALPPPPVTLEISSLRHVDGDVVDYHVSPDSRAAGRRVKELALPSGVVIALIARNEQIIPPQGHTRIETGDHVILVLRPGTRPLVDRIFSRVVAPRDKLPEMLEFPLRGSIRVGELEEFYGIKMSAPATMTLDEAIRQRFGNEPARLDGIVRFGAIALHVHELDPDGKVAQVGMVIQSDEAAAPPDPPLPTLGLAHPTPADDPRDA